jgi:hypothetical protein
MANNISVTDLVSNIALAKFINNNSMLMTANRGYEGDFKMASYKIGDTLNIRQQNHYIVGDGRIGAVQDINEETEPLTIDHQYHTLISYSSKELTLDIDNGLERFAERYIDPAIQEIVHQMEVQIGLDAVNQLNFLTGSAGSPISSFSAVDLTGAKMLEQAMPMKPNAYMNLSVRDGSALKASLQNNFNETLNQDISFYSKLGRLSYFDMFQNQAIARHTTGTFDGSPDVDGAVASGNTVVLKGATPSQTGVFKQGDVVSFSGVYSVNPVGRANTGQLMQFLVTADANSTGGGAVTLTLSPSIISDPANSRRNVSNAIADNATVTLAGVTSPGTPVTYNVNTAYCSRGLDIVVPPLERLDVVESFVKTDPDTNVSIRVSKQGDILNDVNVLRLDVLCGFKWHNQYAVKLIS